MEEEKKSRSQYDWLFKENIEDFFLELISKELDIDILNYTIQNPQVHKVMEKREMDFLCEIETRNGKELLHIEIHTTNDKNMVDRIGEYHAFLMRERKKQKKEALPIRHIVIYIGEKKATMPTKLEADKVYLGFDLLDLSSIKARKLLSKKPSKLALIIPLCNMKEEEREDILKTVISHLKSISLVEGDFKKELSRLFTLSGLRDWLPELLTKLINDMAFAYNVTEHPFFQKGIEKGIEKGKIESVLGFYKNDVSIPVISKSLNISEKKIQEIIKLGRMK